MIDTRIRVVKDIVAPFQTHLDNIIEICKSDNAFYWDSFYADDVEHIVGTVFIVLQNYINSSISDLFPDLSKLFTKYSEDIKVNNSQTTRIQLIISIANYYKHRDLPTELDIHTVNPLIDLNIEYKEIFPLLEDVYFHKVGSDSPVFNGFSLLSEKWNLNDLINIVSEWRENLWQKEEKNLIKRQLKNKENECPY